MIGMKLNKNFILHHDGKETMLVSTGAGEFSGIVRGNETAGYILSCLAEDVTEAEILTGMQKKFDGDRDVMEADMQKILAQLRGIGAIDDEIEF